MNRWGEFQVRFDEEDIEKTKRAELAAKRAAAPEFNASLHLDVQPGDIDQDCPTCGHPYLGAGSCPACVNDPRKKNRLEFLKKEK